MDVFDFTRKDALNATQEPEGNKDFFNPKPTKEKEYTVTVRLLPWMTNPANSIVSSAYHWLTDATGGFRSYEPPIPGVKYGPVSQRYFKLKEDGDDRHKQLGVQNNHGAIIQIKNDQVNPDNNGKVFMYRIPVKVFKRMMAYINPSEADIKAGKKPKDLLNPFDGYDFTLKIKQTDDGRNYDDSFIAEDRTSILIDGAPVGERNAETEAKVMAFLKEQAEKFNLEEIFGHKMATDQELVRIKGVLVNQFGADPNILPGVSLVAATAVPAQPAQPAEPAAPSAQSAENTTAPAQPAEPAAPAATETATTNTDGAPAATEQAAGSSVEDIVAKATGQA